MEIILSKLRKHPSPKPSLEQYAIPPDAAAEILFIASQMHDDIRNKKVVDLGCGVGFLAIGAALLGARETIGVDLDGEAVKIAKLNSKLAGVKGKIQWVAGDIAAITGKFDTVLQNPPFGVRRRGADVPFLEKALEVGEVVYTLHKSGEKNRRFIKDRILSKGGRISKVFQIELIIPKTFNFHVKRKHAVKADLYRVVKDWGEIGGRKSSLPPGTG